MGTFCNERKIIESQRKKKLGNVYLKKKLIFMMSLILTQFNFFSIMSYLNMAESTLFLTERKRRGKRCSVVTLLFIPASVQLYNIVDDKFAY